MRTQKNITGITVVTLLHIALLAAFLHGSKLKVFHPKETMATLEPTLPPVPPKQEEPPPQVKPMVVPDWVPLPVVPVAVQEAPTITHVSSETPPPVLPHTASGAGTSETAPPVKAEPVRVAAVVDVSACTKPEYPKSSLRNGDTGVVTLALLVGTDGRVADSKVEKTSGFRELDRAAQNALSLCKFKPGTVDGVAQQSWTRMQYVWSLND